jgi:hypothetical protein
VRQRPLRDVDSGTVLRVASQHATEENTVLLIDGVLQEPRFRPDGEIIVPRFPPMAEDGYYR